MFSVLSEGFKSAQLSLKGKTRLSEDNLAPALREVRASLIQADVELGVIKRFLDRVKERALGEIVPLRDPSGRKVKVTPQDWFIKACYDELVELMGPEGGELNLEGDPGVVMLVGLQGAGKTTTCGKLAKHLLAQGKRPMLVAADIYRPAAVEQLTILGRKLGVPVFSMPGVDPVELSRMAIKQARNLSRDVVLIDTAGRLAIDDKLMAEVVAIRGAVRPKDVLFVVDGMMGQDAVRTAAAFDKSLDFTGFVITKLDGDARGGAALSIKEVTGKPVAFLGQGEALDRLEAFRPEGLAQRILGFGDIVGLMQDFERHVDQEEAEKSAERMLRGEFTYTDFVKQMKMLRNMGPMREIFSRMPGISSMMDRIPKEALDEAQLDRTMAIIQSMTKEERNRPSLLSDSRFRRIAKGCGRTMSDVKELHDRFLQAKQMMAGLGGMMGGGGLAGLGQQLGGGFGGMPGMGFGGAPAKERPVLSAEDKRARRKKQKAARKARKRNRK